MIGERETNMQLITKIVRGPMGRMYSGNVPLTKYEMGRFHFVWHIAMRMTGGWSNPEDGKKNLKHAAGLLNDFLADSRIKFGAEGYGWTPIDAYTIAEEYGLRE